MGLLKRSPEEACPLISQCRDARMPLGHDAAVPAGGWIIPSFERGGFALNPRPIPPQCAVPSQENDSLGNLSCDDPGQQDGAGGGQGQEAGGAQEIRRTHITEIVRSGGSHELLGPAVVLRGWDAGCGSQGRAGNRQQAPCRTSFQQWSAGGRGGSGRGRR